MNMIEAILNKARKEEIIIFLKWLQKKYPQDISDEYIQTTVRDFLYKNKQYPYDGIDDMKAISWDIKNMTLPPSIINRDELLRQFYQIQETTRKKWLTDFQEHKELQINKDFKTNHDKEFGDEDMVSSRPWFLMDLHVGSMFRNTFVWCRTTQGFDVWNIINACYLRAVPIEITNKLYCKLIEKKVFENIS